MENDHGISETIKNYGAVAAAASVLAGFVLACRKKIMSGWRAVRRFWKWLHDAYQMVDSVGIILVEVNGGQGKPSMSARIDKQSRALDEMRLSILAGEQRMRRVLDRFPMGVYECAPDGKCLWVNKTLAEMWGEEHDDMLGWGWLARIHSDDREPTHTRWMSSIGKGIPYRSTYRVEPKGSPDILLVRTEAERICNPTTGELMLLVGTVEIVKRDLTEPMD